MKSAFLLPAAIVIVAIVLSLSARGQFAEKRRLADEFASAQESISLSSAADLAHEWAELDEDGRLVATLASQMGQERICSAQRTTPVYEAFRALATAVRYYRSITLFPPACSAPISAIDPSEPPEVAKWLVAQSIRLGEEATRPDGRGIHGPVRADDGREFFFYVTVAPDVGPVTLAVEARLLFQRVLRPRSQHGQYVLLDSDGGLWFGCTQSATCTRMPLADWQKKPALTNLAAFMRRDDRGVARTQDKLADDLGIGGPTALVAWSSFMAAGPRWAVAVIVSPDALDAHEKAIIWRLILTGAALALSVGGIAALGIVLQRREAALQARLRLVQQESDLRSQTEKIINNVPAGLIGVAADGRVATVNRFIRERYSPVRVGAALGDAFPQANSGAARQLASLLKEAIHSRRQITLSQPDADMLSPTPGRFEVRLVPIDDPTERIAAIVLIKDLSELRNLERQLVRAEKLATVGVLTAGLAHEVGTPLGIIRVRAETFRESLPANESHSLSSIIGQIDRISATIRQLLDFSREQTVSPSPTNAVATARNAADLLDWRFRQKNLQCTVEAEMEDLFVAADPNHLQQVIVNLLMNSCDACRERGTIRLSLKASDADERMVRIDVEDDGCGIPPEYLNAVFDPFFTTKKRGEGTGLGLSVVASIVRNYGGQISIASAPGERTTVSIVWPASKDDRKAS